MPGARGRCQVRVPVAHEHVGGIPVRERWLPVGLLAAGLFATNLIARVVVRLTGSKSDTSQTRIGFIAIIVVSVVMIGAAYWWARRNPMPRVLADLAVAVAVACLLSVLVGP